MNIALISPNKNAYSETFILQHKTKLKGKVFYYYDGFLPKRIEDEGILELSWKRKFLQKLKRKFKIGEITDHQLILIKSFRKNNIKILFAEYGETAQQLIPVCKFLDLPMIVHFHGYDASIKSVLKKHDYYKETFEYCKYVVVVSKKMFENFISLGCPKEKLIYSVCGPDSKFQNIIPRYEKEQFIAIGRFVNKKAPYNTILAFKNVLENWPNAKLIMAGDGYLLEVCQSLVKYYSLEKNIKFVGVITPEKYREYLEESIGFIQHSVTADDGDSEGTPVALLEASAAGLPIISTHHAGISDVVIDSKTGFLSYEHDVDQMANNISKILADRELAMKMGRKGKKRINEEFSLNKHLEILNKLIEKSLME